MFLMCSHPYDFLLRTFVNKPNPRKEACLMSTNRKNAPVATHRDGQTFTKVWGNQNDEGQLRYTTTIGYTYTDKESGEPRESRNLRDSDLLRLPHLATLARDSIRQFKAQDREQGQSRSPDQQSATQSEREEFRQSRQRQAPSQEQSHDQGPQGPSQ